MPVSTGLGRSPVKIGYKTVDRIPSAPIRVAPTCPSPADGEFDWEGHPYEGLPS
jgi:hypothetical protein